jgi:hypothetical protein
VTFAGFALLATATTAPAKYWHRGGRRLSTCKPQMLTEALAPTAIAPNSYAYARFRQDDRCRLDFHVPVEDIAAGDDALVVGGIVRGTIPVRQSPTTACFDAVYADSMPEGIDNPCSEAVLKMHEMPSDWCRLGGGPDLWSALHICISQDMRVHMRTSIDIPEPLLRRARAAARKRKTTLRAVLLDGLRQALDAETPSGSGYALPDESFGEGGVNEGVTISDWERIRDLSYAERG